MLAYGSVRIHGRHKCKVIIFKQGPGGKSYSNSSHPNKIIWKIKYRETCMHTDRQKEL